MPDQAVADDVLTELDVHRVVQPVRFYRWLKQFALEDIVGHKESACKCPIAAWLHSTLGAKVSVGTTDIDVDGIKVATPEWVKRYVDRIDNYSGNPAIPTRVAVTQFRYVVDELGLAL